MPHTKEKFYTYVDESGQDTAGKIFLVTVVIVEKQRDELRKRLRVIEKLSRKGIKKWTKATRKQRMAYIQTLGSNMDFVGTIYFSYYPDTKSYVDLTILTTAKAILYRAKEKRPYEARVYIDGMRSSEQHQFTAGLRKLHVALRMAKGLKDEADEFIRLADAIAGFIRDSTEGEASTKKTQKILEKKGILKKI